MRKTVGKSEMSVQNVLLIFDIFISINNRLETKKKKKPNNTLPQCSDYTRSNVNSVVGDKICT